jgi:DNA-binding PadR family transcriptional regulator
VIHSVLDLFILSLLDRGLETPYDLQRQGGLSLGSTVPALKRLETAGLVRKKAPVGSSKRPRHSFQLSAAGKKVARSGWGMHLMNPNQMDLDAVLRVADMGQYYNAKTTDIVAFLETAASERRVSARSSISASSGLLKHAAMREAWDVVRLRAEATFLLSSAEAVSLIPRKNSKAV